MDELFQDKVDEHQKGDRGEPGMDLMGQLVQSHMSQTQADGKGKGAVSGKESTSTARGLTKSEIIGNAFIMLLAGHETTANAMHFSIVELAANPSTQRQLQKDIDAILGSDSDPTTWNFENHINAMQACMIGACMNETLRLLPPVVEVPKKVTPHQDQVLTLDGEKHVLPKGCVVSLVLVSAHRNPRNWPTRPSKIREGVDDLDDFVPERWFRKSADAKESGAASDDSDSAEDFGGYQGRDTSAQLFRPPRGAYAPFSDGARSCLGRRIAQVEVLAGLAVIFQKYSVELAVDDWATDEEVEKMNQQERGAVYKKAQQECRRKISAATSILTLKLHGDKVPIRVVPRGEERFVNWAE
jgi:cytochrome P450